MKLFFLDQVQISRYASVLFIAYNLFKRVESLLYSICYHFVGDNVYVFRCYTKELRKESSAKSIMSVIQGDSYVCRVSYLLPSLTDPEQCRKSVASVVLEGMHIVSIHVLVHVFQHRLNDHLVLLANF